MPYLIDGHNVIAALPDISLEDDNDEVQLIIKLRSWLGQSRRKAVVIFDGGIPGGPSTSLSTINIKVIFAARHYTIADAIIIERVRALPDPGNWTVISSDREVIERAEHAGAKTMTAQTFADFLNQQITFDKEKPEGLGAGELEHWLDVFPEVKESPKRSTKAPAQAAAPANVTQRQGHKHHPAKAAAQPAPKQGPARGARSIGEQMGYSTAPDPETKPIKPQGEKPQESSEEEITAWLEVFPEPERSFIPPPNLPRRKKKKPAEAKPVVRKDGELSEGEVNAWLQVFGPEAESIEANAPPRPPKLKPKTRKVSSTLAKHQENLTPLDKKSGDSAIPEDELEMWYRMFGRDEE